MQLLFHKTFQPGDYLRAYDLNKIMSTLQSWANGGIGNDNLSSATNSKIAESKISWDLVNGHYHDGVQSRRRSLPPMVIGVGGSVYNGENSAPLRMTESRPVTDMSLVAGSRGAVQGHLEYRAPGATDWITLTSISLSAEATMNSISFPYVFPTGSSIRLLLSDVGATAPKGVSLIMWQGLS